MFVVFVFFFFSSRRRHTRCLNDWSSDVCSSDLTALPTELLRRNVGAKTVRCHFSATVAYEWLSFNAFPLIINQMLYQLSYASLTRHRQPGKAATSAAKSLMSRGRIEPPAAPDSGSRSWPSNAQPVTRQRNIPIFPAFITLQAYSLALSARSPPTSMLPL